MSSLARLEQILEDEAVTACIARIEATLPVGVRPRQLPVRSLLLGMLLTQDAHRPAHLTRLHACLCGLPESDRRRLGVLSDWKGEDHLLTYRQVEYLMGLVDGALANKEPDGLALKVLSELLNGLLEASIPAIYKKASSSLAVDWTDYESFAHPPGKNGISADPQASWGHRRGGGPGGKSELFFGDYLSLSTMVKNEDGDEVPELVRQMTLSSCCHDPVVVLVEALEQKCADGLVLSDVLADSGYAHRVPEHFALRVRALGAELVMDLHPQDRGPQGTFAGAVLNNGNCYCPATPRALLDLGPLPRDANRDEIAATTKRRPSSPVTSSGRSAKTTPTATTASAVRQSRASCAARCGPNRSASPMRGPRSPLSPSTRLCAVSSEASPSRLVSTRRPGRNTTIRAGPTVTPMPGAPPSNARTHG